MFMSKFTLKKRIKLCNFLRNGKTYRWISLEIGICISSISDEINKNGGICKYNAWDAEAESEIRKRTRYKRLKLEISQGLRRYVIEKLQEDWSPEQVSGELKRLAKGRSVLSHETIYQFVYSKKGEYLGLWKHLRHRAKYKTCKRRSWSKRNRKGPTIPCRVSIHKRPKFVDLKEDFGHWEADLMVFSKSKSVLAVFVERHTKQTFSFVNGIILLRIASLR